MVLTLVHFILNLVALVLWLNWLTISADAAPLTPASSLLGTLKKAGPRGLGRNSVRPSNGCRVWIGA
jgi:hypothetical protein